MYLLYAEAAINSSVHTVFLQLSIEKSGNFHSIICANQTSAPISKKLIDLKHSCASRKSKPASWNYLLTISNTVLKMEAPTCLVIKILHQYLYPAVSFPVLSNSVWCFDNPEADPSLPYIFPRCAKNPIRGYVQYSLLFFKCLSIHFLSS